MKIRETKREDEIQSVIQGAIDEGKTFIVWQRDESDHITFQARTSKVRAMEKGQYEFKFNHEIPYLLNNTVFFAVEDSTVVFKTADVNSTKHSIFIATPSEAKYKERRRFDRKRFRMTKHHIEIKFQSKNLEMEEETVVISQLVDLSDGGACVIISKVTFECIDLEKPIEIKSLTNIQLPGDKAKIMNKRDYAQNKSFVQGEVYAVGIMFL